MIDECKGSVSSSVRNLHELQVIIKIAERCNLACTYCYYFFMGDDSYKERDPIMKQDKFAQVAGYLVEGVQSMGIREVSVVFHGGEPTLMKARNFRALVSTLRDALAPICSLSLGIQTNGYHLTKEWEEVLSDFSVSVGVSLDGPPEYNDQFRITHSGGGSHKKIARTVGRLHELEREQKINAIGVLSVLGRDTSIEDTFDHFVDDLQFRYMGFLLPDRSHDTPFVDGESAERYGDMLIALFNRWLDRQDIVVREVTKVTRYFQEYVHREIEAADIFDKRTHIVVIQSTGEINCDDSLIPALEWRSSQRSYSIFNSTLHDFINDPGLVSLDRARAQLPNECASCEWVKICGGGALENRFSRARGFDNPSIYCDGLKKYYSYIASYLVENGYPEAIVQERLRVTGLREPTVAI